MKNKKGFTLAELLIVVAIIGVLVAISIPIFTGQLKKSRAAVDRANVRSGKAAAVAQYLTDGFVGEQTYYYDAAKGTVVLDASGIKGYGKSDEDLTGNLDDYATGIPKDGYVAITIKEDGTIEAAWNGSGSGKKGTVDQNAQAFVQYRTEKSKNTMSEWLGDIHNKHYRNWKKGESITIAGTVYISLTNENTISGSSTTTAENVTSQLESLVSSSGTAFAVTETTKVLVYSEIIDKKTPIAKGTVVYGGRGYQDAPQYYVALTDTTAESVLTDTSIYAVVH